MQMYLLKHIMPTHTWTNICWEANRHRSHLPPEYDFVRICWYLFMVVDRVSERMWCEETLKEQFRKCAFRSYLQSKISRPIFNYSWSHSQSAIQTKQWFTPPEMVVSHQAGLADEVQTFQIFESDRQCLLGESIRKHFQMLAHGEHDSWDYRKLTFACRKSGGDDLIKNWLVRLWILSDFF